MKRISTQKKKDRKLRARLLRKYFFDKMVLSIYRYIRNKLFSFRRRTKEKPIVLWGIITLVIISAGIVYIFLATKDVEDSTNIIGEIVCAIISGVITVFGIAWTLYSQQKIQKEEDRLAIRPYITYGAQEKDEIIPIKVRIGDSLSTYSLLFPKNDLKIITPEHMGQNKWICSYGSFFIHVADYAECCFDSIMIDDERYFVEPPHLLRKGSTYQLDFSDYYFKMQRREDLRSVSICVADMRSNLYYYSLDTDRGTNKNLDFEIYNKKGKKIGMSVFKITGISAYTDNYDKIILKKENAQCGTPLTGYWDNLKRFIFHREELANQLVANHRLFYRKRK